MDITIDEDSKLTEKQQECLNIMRSGKNIFVTGPAGCGKSFLIKYYKEFVNPNAPLTSTTGISAIQVQGSTVHSYLGIGIGDDDVDGLFNKIKLFKKGPVWKSLETLIIDEISMMDPCLFDKLEEIARRFKNCEKPFGGIQIILVGDFAQLPCINESKKFCFHAKSWSKVVTNVVYMPEIIRQSDPEFTRLLCKIRMNEDFDESAIEKCFRPYDTDQIEPVKLFAVNRKVDHINKVNLTKMLSKNDAHHFKAFVSLTKDPQKILRNMNIVENLVLCVGLKVMLSVNVDVNSGYVNGSVGAIESFDENGIPQVKFKNGTISVIPVTIEIKENRKLVAIVKFTPLRLAYAFTIHKTQGCTLDNVEVDFKDIFEYGQAYVAMSRTKCVDNLYIRNYNRSKIMTDPRVIEFYQQYL